MGCSFCWDPMIHKRKWRTMKPETVLKHIEHFIAEYGIRGFLFTDDNFFLDMKRAYSILEGVVDSKLDISIGKLQIRADAVYRMDDRWFQLLVQAKVKRLMIGVESGSQKVLDLLNKSPLLGINRQISPVALQSSAERHKKVIAICLSGAN